VFLQIFNTKYFSYQKIILSNLSARRAARGGQSSHDATWITSLKQHPDGLAPSCDPAAYSGIRI
jgi:hypothetical protein